MALYDLKMWQGRVALPAPVFGYPASNLTFSQVSFDVKGTYNCELIVP